MRALISILYRIGQGLINVFYMENTTASHKVTPKFFFVSLGVLVSLIASVTSILNLAFETLNKRFPDILNGTYSYGYSTFDYAGMRTALAVLIIVFPVFIALSFFWIRFIKAGLSHGDAVIKKWMLYLVVFLSAVVILTDLITLVNYFVSGEITGRFTLKVVVTFIVAGLAGTYYFLELAGKAERHHYRLIAVLKASAIVLAAIVCAFMVMGSPFTQRQLRLDERRVSDLQMIQSQVITYWQQKEKLPTKLADVATPISGATIPVDPEFEKGFVYVYRKTAPLTFELCATFSLPMPKGVREYSYGYGAGSVELPMKDVASPAPYPGGANDSWDHESGRTCFSRTIDKDIYPPFTK